MKLLLFLLAISTVLCDNFTSLVLDEANCVLVIRYTNATSFDLLACYQFKRAIQSTTLWDDCAKRCCSPEKTYEQTSSSLENCDQDRKDYSKPGDIAFFIINGLLLVMVVWAGCGIVCHRSALRQIQIQPLLPQSARQAHIDPSAPEYHIELEALQSPFRPQAVIEWMKQQRKNEACPICLSGDTEVELAACKHLVHWECWKKWSAMKSQCAICRSDDVSLLKIYCFGCKGAYFECRNDDLQNQQSCPNLVCEECKGRNLTQ